MLERSLQQLLHPWHTGTARPTRGIVQKGLLVSGQLVAVEVWVTIRAWPCLGGLSCAASLFLCRGLCSQAGQQLAQRLPQGLLESSFWVCLLLRSDNSV